MQDEFNLRLTQEEGFLLLTGARLFDKLVAGVTIHAQEKDELIRDVINKLAKIISPQMNAMSNELADAIVDSVLGCAELDESELEELELACLESDLEEMLINEFFSNPPPRQLSIEGLGENTKTFEKLEPMDIDDDDRKRVRSTDSYSSKNTKSSNKPGNKSNNKPGNGTCNHPNTPPFYNDEDEDRHRTPAFGDSATRKKFESFLADETFSYPMYSIEDKLPILEKALLKHLAVKVNYYCIEREVVDSVKIDPLVLLQQDGLWLAVAYCHERDDILIFRVDRMKDVAETAHRFETPRNINELRCQMLTTYK